MSLMNTYVPRVLGGWAVLSIAALCTGASDCSHDCSSPDTFEVRVTDATGNAVPIDSVEATAGTVAVSCVPNFSGYRESGTGRAVNYTFGCSLSEPATVVVRVSTQGQVLEQVVEVRSERTEHCGRVLVAPWVNLNLPGPGCPLRPQRPAITGSVIDSDGTPLAGTIYVGGELCELSNGFYRCHARAKYAQNYLWHGEFGLTRVEKVIHVPATNCEPETQEFTIDLSRRVCPTMRAPAVQANLRARPPGEADPPIVRASVEGGAFRDCDVMHLPGNEYRGLHLYRFTCAAQTAKGGGLYTLQFIQGGDVLTEQRAVSDDGCVPYTSTTNVVGLVGD